MAAITEDAIKELAAFRSAGAPVVTCYLDVDGRRRPRPVDYEHELEHLVREASQRAVGADAAADLGRIVDHVKAGFDRSRVRGLALFSCEAEGLWRVIELPVAVHDRVVVNAAPAVAQLEAVAQESARVGVLAADKHRARVFVFELGELVTSREVVDELPRDIDSVGHRERGDQSHHSDELVAQHLRHAARVAFETFQDSGVRDILLAVPDSLVSSLEKDLHPYLAERLRGRLHVRIDSPLDEIRDEVLEMEHELTLARESQLVERLLAAVGGGDRGVAGLAPTLAALGERRVDTLVVSSGFGESGWRCGACRGLASIGRTCPACGAEMAHVDDVVEEAVDLAFAQGCRVEVVEGNADLDVHGRVGALLRY